MKVIYDDNQIVVVIKPQNIPTQADESGDKDVLSLVKDFVNVYEGKSQEVFEIALNYNDKDLKKKITNWTPSKEMKEELEMVIDKYGLKRLKMKYNMACDMILLHY